METTLEETGKHSVRLSVEVPADEMASEIDRAYRKIGREIKVPGFRKGHVPRRIIDARVGREAVLEEFVHESVPRYYGLAVRERELAPISEPEISIDQLEEGKPLLFSASFEIRPRLHLDDYRGVRVERPSSRVGDLEVDEFVDRLRERFAELEIVAHPARRGDYVIADIRATVHEREIEQASFQDHLYEVGSGELVAELDGELEGKRKGEILRFNAKLPERFGEVAGQEVSFQVLVKEVKAKRLPDADDEFAKMASEFDTLEELRADLREKLQEAKAREADSELRNRVLEAVVSGIDVELPERLVDDETEQRVHQATERAERAGLTLEQVLASQDWDELRFRSDARAHATRALKADLVLEAVARAEGLTVSPEELGAEVAKLAQILDRDPKEVGRMLERSGQVTTLAGDIIRTKALDVLVEHAEVIEADEPLKREAASAEASSEPPPSNQGASE
jgi:trigger factor